MTRALVVMVAALGVVIVGNDGFGPALGLYLVAVTTAAAAWMVARGWLEPPDRGWLPPSRRSWRVTPPDYGPGWHRPASGPTLDPPSSSRGGPS